MKTQEVRRKEAKERIEAVKDLTPTQRLARLDERLGPGVGAKKERARLAEKMKPTRAKEAKQKEKK